MLFIFEKQENSQNEILQIFLKIKIHFEQIRIRADNYIDNLKKNQYINFLKNQNI